MVIIAYKLCISKTDSSVPALVRFPGEFFISSNSSVHNCPFPFSSSWTTTVQRLPDKCTSYFVSRQGVRITRLSEQRSSATHPYYGRGLRSSGTSKKSTFQLSSLTNSSLLPDDLNSFLNSSKTVNKYSSQHHSLSESCRVLPFQSYTDSLLPRNNEISLSQAQIFHQESFYLLIHHPGLLRREETHFEIHW